MGGGWKGCVWVGRVGWVVCFALYHDNIWHSWEGVGGIIGSLLRHWVQVEWGGGRNGWVGDLLGSLPRRHLTQGGDHGL